MKAHTFSVAQLLDRDQAVGQQLQQLASYF